MAKWADYVIKKVRFNAAGTHIDQVEVADDRGDDLGPSRYENRATVIKNLKDKKTYCTAPPAKSGESGKYDKGALVRIIDVNGTEYIRSDANKTARDNLDNLPTF
jgi:hypothetical protein